MSSIVIAGDTSGSVTLQAPAVAGATILTRPATSGTVQTSGAGYTTNGVAFASSTSVLATGSALSFNGAQLGVVNGAGAAILKLDGTSAPEIDFYSSGVIKSYIYAPSTSLQLNTLSSNPIIFLPNEAEGMRLTTTGLGIGTSSPAQKLHVLGDQSVALFQGTTFGGITFLKSGSTGMQLFSDATGTLKIYDNNAGATVLAMVSQNLGVGTASPQSKLHVSDAVAGGQLLVTSNENNSSAKIGSLATMNYTNAEEPVLAISVEGGASENIVQIGGGPGEFNAATLIKFSTAANTTTTGGTERGRFASDGTFNVDCTAIPNGVNRRGFQVIPDTGVNDTTKVLIATTTTSTRALIEFNNGNGNVGSINTSSSATSYVTSSDYRLKNTIAPMTGALAKVALLKPCIYKWNADGSDGEGFIAHELAEVVPQCVTGEKDAVDDEGNPKYQGIDTSFLVATLTAAIKEQQALITQLTERITALEAK